MTFGIEVLSIVLPWTALAMLGFSSFINWNYKRVHKSIANEMQRLMEVYVTQGRWDVQNTVISRKAAETLKSKLIIK
jgi:hypothetical protein